MNVRFFHGPAVIGTVGNMSEPCFSRVLKQIQVKAFGPLLKYFKNV